MKNLSTALSVLFNPLLVTSYLFWILSAVYPEILWPYTSRQYLFLWAILAIGTLLMPAVSILFLKFSGHLSDFEMRVRQERSIPFFFIVFWYGVSTFLLISWLDVSWHLSFVLVGTTLLIAIPTIITVWYKISIHTAGIWGAVGFLTAILVKGHQSDVLWPLSFAFLAAGAVSSARLYLNLHTFNQVIYGAAVGFVISFCCLFILW